MWKIIKADLMYFRAPMIMIWTFFILISTFSPLIIKFDRYKPSGSEYLHGLVIWIIVLHLIFVFAHLFYEYKENRTRRLTQLPLANSQIALVRILNPLVFFILSVLLITVCMLILTVVYPTPVTFNESIGYLGIVKRDPTVPLQLLGILGLWLACVYFIRLLSEWQGRLLIGIGVGLAMFYHWLLRLISYKLVLILKDVWYTVMHVPAYTYLMLFLVPLTLMVLLSIFFRTRRSYTVA